MSTFKADLVQVEWTSLAYCVGFLVLGFFDFKRRKLSK
jgi:hypothetical protein